MNRLKILMIRNLMYNKNEIIFTSKKLDKMFRPWWELEEYQPDGGMWKSAQNINKKQMIQNAVLLLKKHDTNFMAACKTVIMEWPISCYERFTTNAMNQVAWLGQAACFITIGSVEENTRLAWHELTDKEQKLANKTAKMIIEKWKLDNLNKLNSNNSNQQLLMFGEI